MEEPLGYITKSGDCLILLNLYPYLVAPLLRKKLHSVILIFKNFPNNFPKPLSLENMTGSDQGVVLYTKFHVMQLFLANITNKSVSITKRD